MSGKIKIKRIPKTLIRRYKVKDKNIEDIVSLFKTRIGRELAKRKLNSIISALEATGGYLLPAYMLVNNPIIMPISQSIQTKYFLRYISLLERTEKIEKDNISKEELEFAQTLDRALSDIKYGSKGVKVRMGDRMVNFIFNMRKLNISTLIIIYLSATPRKISEIARMMGTGYENVRRKVHDLVTHGILVRRMEGVVCRDKQTYIDAYNALAMRVGYLYDRIIKVSTFLCLEMSGEPYVPVEYGLYGSLSLTRKSLTGINHIMDMLRATHFYDEDMHAMLNDIIELFNEYEKVNGEELIIEWVFPPKRCVDRFFGFRG